VNIAEFAKRCGLSAHTLRYYERIGLLGAVARQSNGHRSFGARDVEWVEFVHRLRSTGMSIQEMLRYAELRARGASTLGQRKAMLEQHAEQLARVLRAQRAHLSAVRQKIAAYEGLTDESTTALT
jgi:DNA-binding transcriptional MerR regulator